MSFNRLISISVMVIIATSLLISPSTYTSFAQLSNKTDQQNERENVKNSSIAHREPSIFEGISKYGNYKVQVNWTSNDKDNENIFKINFLDAKSGKEIRNVNYIIMLFKGETSLLGDTIRKNQTSTQQNYTIGEPGEYNLRITSINESRDKIDIPLLIKSN